MNDRAILEIAGIGLAAILCQWIAWRVRLPAILFLLLAGILAGPVTGWLDADRLFGELLLPFVSLSVAVILFEGSLTLQFHQIRGLERVVRNMVSVGILVSWLAITLAARWAVGLSWELSFLFGAVTLVTGPTVITPLLRTVRPVQSVAHILRWEGIVIDPIGALLAVLVFEFIAAVAGALGHTLLSFGRVVAIGLAAGFTLGEVLRRAWLPDYLESFATLALVFGVFAASNAFAAESGLISVTAMGIWLANRKGLVVEEIRAFKENLSLLLISALFIILAARLDLSRLRDLGYAALLVLLAMQFIVRPLMVAISTWGSNLSWRERALLAWIAPRGIVAAAVSALFAVRLGQFGYADAEVLLSLTFFVIIGTVVLQSATAGTLARWLGVAEPEPMGFLIVGANSVARAIGEALIERKVPVLLTDINWENISQARMAGLPVYFGSPISEHAARYLETTGLGRLLAMSPDENFNLLALTRYRGEFGRNAVYELRVWPAGVALPQHEVAEHHKGRTLFGGDVTYGTLARMLNHGAEIRSTKLTESFDFEQYLNAHRRSAIPLSAAGPKGRFEAFSSDSDLKPVAGWTILSLVGTAHLGLGDDASSERARYRAWRRTVAGGATLGGLPARFVSAGTRALAFVSPPFHRGTGEIAPCRSAALLRRARVPGRASGLRPLARAAALVRVGGVCQAPLRRPPGGTGPPVPLYPSGGDLEPATGSDGQWQRELPLEGLPRQGAHPPQDDDARSR